MGLGNATAIACPSVIDTAGSKTSGDKDGPLSGEQGGHGSQPLGSHRT